MTYILKHYLDPRFNQLRLELRVDGRMVVDVDARHDDCQGLRGWLRGERSWAVSQAKAHGSCEGRL